jgi:hypothetical protein
MCCAFKKDSCLTSVKKKTFFKNPKLMFLQTAFHSEKVISPRLPTTVNEKNAPVTQFWQHL